MIVTRKEFPSIRQRHKDQVIVYCSGSFDLTHARHVLFLANCKAQGDILVVGVGTDYDIRKNSANNGRPIQGEQVRLYMVDNLKPVDYTCLNERMKEGQHPLKSEAEVLELLCPNIYAINDDAFDIPYRQYIAKELGVRLTIGKRGKDIPLYLKDISTTELIEIIQGRA